MTLPPWKKKDEFNPSFFHFLFLQCKFHQWKSTKNETTNCLPAFSSPVALMNIPEVNYRMQGRILLDLECYLENSYQIDHLKPLSIPNDHFHRIIHQIKCSLCQKQTRLHIKTKCIVANEGCNSHYMSNKDSVWLMNCQDITRAVYCKSSGMTMEEICQFVILVEV